MTMNPFMSGNIPSFIEKELEAIDQLVKPKLKKSSRYLIISIPLLAISIINLFIMLILTGYQSSMLLALGIYALLGAIGAALFKESRQVNKEIRQIGMDHIIQRIKASELINHERKDQYISQIKTRPKLSLQTFFNFLSEEHQRQY